MLLLKRTAPYCLLLILTLLFFWKLAFTDMILVRGDTFSYFYPYREIRNAALREGRLPLWTPDIFMGAPLLADPQVATFYLPDWLFVPLNVLDGTRLTILLHVFGAGIGTYLLFQKTVAPSLHVARDGAGFPALTAAIIFAFGGFTGAHVEQINQLQGLAWMPWLFLLLHQTLSNNSLAEFSGSYDGQGRPRPCNNTANLAPVAQLPVLSPQPTAPGPQHPAHSTRNIQPRRIVYLLLFAAALTMQFFSGHTQTVFITGIGLAIYALVQGISAQRVSSPSLDSGRAGVGLRTQSIVSLQRAFRGVLILAAGVMLALALAVPQLLPSLELTGMSNRGGGGFNAQEATAFSLPLAYIGRALLPSYDGLLFTEYIGYVGVIALGLVIKGITQRHEDAKAQRILWLIIGFIGLFFAFGRYNPLYLALAELPGFNLFRVPARWLALFSLAAAMLAGMGMKALSAQRSVLSDSRPRISGRKRLIRAMIVFGPLLALMMAARFFTIAPEDVFGEAIPANTTLILWGAGLLALAGILGGYIAVGRGTFRCSAPGRSTLRPYSEPGTQHSALSTALPALALTGIILELFLASQILPCNDLAPRDSYEGQRFTVSQLLAYNDGQTPPGRVLSIGGLLFDPGDKSTLQARYDRAGMDALAQHSAFTAVKKQEMLFPNLPLTWGIPSVDGYGGGILPTIYYTQFTSLLLPEDTLRTVDGRLGEMLARPECRGACIPRGDFLALMDVRYLLTDKVYDVWHEGVAYDTTFRPSVTSEAGTRFSTPDNLPFEATRIDVLYQNPQAVPPAVTLSAVNQPYRGLNRQNEPEIVMSDEIVLVRYRLSFPESLNEIGISSGDTLDTTRIIAISLVDARTGDFVQLTPTFWQRILSSDIKIYAPDTTAPAFLPGLLPRRVFVVQKAHPLPDTWQGSEEALALLRETPFFTLHDVMLHGDAPVMAGEHLTWENDTRVESYMTTEIRLQVSAVSDGYLVLNDAWYPGWKAIVNGEPTQVYRANVMFRAVKVPAGESTVIFFFQPDLWIFAIGFGLLAWLLWAMALVVMWRSLRSALPDAQSIPATVPEALSESL